MRSVFAQPDSESTWKQLSRVVEQLEARTDVVPDASLSWGAWAEERVRGAAR